ncbi:MAG: DegT/DnrJ/EryC1/StrS family aminotransferase [Cenarchaeum sp. SB0662_bin_33]|nr:DegT/DnrJ/EryC1/StrS family aminotransferase [Cenarchaeum sp. SB0662_bin_33]
MSQNIRINEPIMDDAEIDAVTSVIKSGVLTSPQFEGGPEVQKLERSVREYTGARHAVAVNSGTVALQASLLALDIKPHSEVIVPSFSYVATANAVKAVGAIPVFADILLNNYTISPDSIRNYITSRTAAIIPVHLYGLVSDIKRIREVAGHIPVIEDAAQSLGSTIDGAHTGTMAEMGCYSLYPGKVVTAGEGGIIVTNDHNMHERLLAIRNHGNVRGAFETFGINARLPEISAAIGRIQMGKLPMFLYIRRRNAAYLDEYLQSNTVRLPTLRQGENPNWNLYTIYTTARDGLLSKLRQKGIGAAIYYKTPIHRTPHYSSKTSLPNTDEASSSVLSIPVHPGVTPDDTSYMAQLINSHSSGVVC